MVRRRPLPYAASQLVDQALMENSDAIRALLPLVRGENVSPEERMRLLAEAIHRIHESTAALREARQVNGQGAGSSEP
jgi:hypothetical protein